MRIQRIGDVDVIRDAVEIPQVGALPINAFVVHSDESGLVDTGRPVEREAFQAALAEAIDPADLKWIWITHPDRDHMGSLFNILERAPQARLITTFMAAGYMSVEFPVPMDRIEIVNPGQSLEVGGGRRLHAFRPPLFDSPMTVGFYDDGSGIAISSDCFGGVLPSLEAADIDDVRELDPEVLREGQLGWSLFDSPWVTTVDPAKFARTYDGLRGFSPELILSTHLPPAPGQLDSFIDLLETVPNLTPPEPPDQAFLDVLLEHAFTVPEQQRTAQPIPASATGPQDAV